MKSLLKFSLLAMCALFFASFSVETDGGSDVVYGVSKNDPSQIRLELHADHTFSYQDFSNAADPVQVDGNWQEVKGKILLEENGTGADFHQKWKISEDGKVAKSRKGMTFYALFRLEE